MNKLMVTMMTLVVMLFAINAFAWDPPASPAPASWISDTSNVFSADAHARLDAKLKQINQSSANEIAALIVPILSGQDISDVANATFKAWGVGKKDLDNGVLVVLAMKEHKSRIETGKGVEGDLPDLKTQDILNNVVRPYMRKGDVEGALSNTFDAISSSIASHKANPTAGGAPSASANGPACDVSEPGTNTGSPWSLIILCGAIGSLLVTLSLLRSRRTQKERQANLAQETERLRKEQSNRRVKAAEMARLQRETVAATATPSEDSLPSSSVSIRDGGVYARAEGVGTAAAASGAGAAVAISTTTSLVVERQKAEAARNRRDEAERKRRKQEEDDDSSSSSSSIWSSDDSSSGGFGGGDSGGGGSSSSW